MKRVFNEQILKFIMTKDKVKMEISMKDLVELFNCYAEEQGCQLRRGVREDFAERLIGLFMSDESTGSDTALWENMFNQAFDVIIENDDELLKVEDGF